MTELFISAFVTLFVVIDPPGCMPIFASLTTGSDAAHRRRMAIRSVTVAGAILFLFAVFGETFLRTLGISLDAFRIAGGIMLFLIALEMVFERRTERRENRAQEVNQSAGRDDISIFPMGIPMIAGPGSITSAMLLTSRSEGLDQSLVVMAALACVLLIMLAALLMATPLIRLLGRSFEVALTRLLGVVLAALAVQFIIDGVRASLG